MRKLVAIEEKLYADGRIIKFGAIRLDDESIPVCLIVNAEDPIGAATDLKRDVETGEVSMEIYLRAEYKLDLDQYDANVYLSPVYMDRTKDNFVVRDGRIRSITLTQIG